MPREGPRLVVTSEVEDEARLKHLRKQARRGVADIEAGRFRDFGSSARLRAHLYALTQRAMGKAHKR